MQRLTERDKNIVYFKSANGDLICGLNGSYNSKKEIHERYMAFDKALEKLAVLEEAYEDGRLLIISPPGDDYADRWLSEYLTRSHCT
jgi:hypothetical protein